MTPPEEGTWDWSRSATTTTEEPRGLFGQDTPTYQQLPGQGGEQPLPTQGEGREVPGSWILCGEHQRVTARPLWTLPQLWHGPEGTAVPALPSRPPRCLSTVFTVF